MAYEEAYAIDSEKFKEASKKAYANNPEKFRKAKGRLMLVILKDLRRLPKIDTMLILKRKGMHPKRHTKQIQKSIKKPLKPIIVSTDNKYVVKMRRICVMSTQRRPSTILCRKHLE